MHKKRHCRSECGARDSVEHDVLAHRKSGVDDPGAPEQVQEPRPPRQADLTEQPIQSETREDSECDMQGGARIGGRVDVLEECHRRVAVPVDAEVGCRRRPEQEDQEPARPDHKSGAAIACEFAAIPEQGGPEGNVDPERKIERHRPRLERHEAVDRRERHDERRALRVVHHPEVGDEEAGDAERRGQHLADPGCGKASLQLQDPRCRRCRHCRVAMFTRS